MAQCVAGDLKDGLLGQLFEIERQVRQSKGYPYDPEKLRRHLQNAIEGNFATVIARTWQVWRTLKIGGIPTHTLFQTLTSGGHFTNDWARDIMSKPQFTTAKSKLTLDLVRVKVRDLGFIESPTTAEIWARAKELGLDLCPAEVGPHLRIVYEDQPVSDFFWVAMEQITDSHGRPHVFVVERLDDGRRWLLAPYADSDPRWVLEDELVFVLRK